MSLPSPESSPNSLPVSASEKSKRLSPRVLTALVGIPIVVVILQIGGWFVAAISLLLALLSMRELVVSTRQSSTRIESGAMVFLIALFFAQLFENALPLLYSASAKSGVLLLIFANLSALLPLISLGVVVFLFASSRKISLPSLSLSVFAALYLSLFAFVPLLQNLPHGRALLWLVLLGVWTGDTVAYYAGRAFGRRKLTPLSPGKSREGALAGFFATLLMSALVAQIAGLEVWRGVVLGICVAVASPLGDLAESFWKRELGVKDLGTLLPGHGGVLDRCDSLLFAAPVAYFYAKMFLK